MTMINDLTSIIKGLLDNGLSYTEIAAKLGVTEITIRRWEKGKNKPHNLFLKELRKMVKDFELKR